MSKLSHHDILQAQYRQEYKQLRKQLDAYTGIFYDNVTHISIGIGVLILIGVDMYNVHYFTAKILSISLIVVGVILLVITYNEYRKRRRLELKIDKLRREALRHLLHEYRMSDKVSQSEMGLYATNIQSDRSLYVKQATQFIAVFLLALILGVNI